MPQLLFVSLLWAFSFSLIKHYLHGVDGAFVAAVRALLALLVFLPFGRMLAISTRQGLRLACIGAIQFGLMYLAYLGAYNYLQGYQVALLALTTPILVVLFDDALDRRFRWTPFAAALVGIAGTLVIVMQKPLGAAEWEGIVLMQLANLCFAAGQVLYRRWKLPRPEVRDRDACPWLYVGAVVATVPVALGRVEFSTLALTATQWGVLAYLGILASGLGFFLWNIGATRVTTGTLAVMNNAKTPLAVLVALLLFGETANLLRLALGGALIFGAAFWAERAGRRRSS